jgi:DNA-binding response OmpR family regulator
LWPLTRAYNASFVAPHNTENLAKSADSPRVSQRALRVLVVDDDPDTVRSLMLLLRTDGYEASGVGSAKAMWEAIGNTQPDVVLLDISLPDASGYQLARDLRRRFGEEADKPVLIAVTAWNKGSDKVLAQIAGFDYHVGKPYSPNQLLSILRSANHR